MLIVDAFDRNAEVYAISGAEKRHLFGELSYAYKGYTILLLADRGRGSMPSMPGRSQNAWTPQEIHERTPPSDEQHGGQFEPYTQPDAAVRDTARRTYI